MIKLWIDYKSPFYIDKLSADGSIDLSRMFWFRYLSHCYNIRIGVDFLNKGFKI